MTDFFNALSHTISSTWALTTWSDITEIMLISTAFYYSALWLKKDHDKNLLAYFYGYLFFIFATHGLELTTLSSMLLLFSPAVAMLFMFMHQQVLQRNFVSLKNITLATQAPSPDWLSSIMKATLTMLTHNKNIIILIEHTDALSPHLHSPELLDVPITDGLISLLFNKVSRPEYLCWISSAGMLRGINVNFKASWHPDAYQTKVAWIDDAVAYTTKTDAVILFADAAQHDYSIVHNGIVKKGLMMEQAHTLIKKLISYQIPLPKKGLSYGVTSQTNLTQRTP